MSAPRIGSIFRIEDEYYGLGEHQFTKTDLAAQRSAASQRLLNKRILRLALNTDIASPASFLQMPKNDERLVRAVTSRRVVEKAETRQLGKTDHAGCPGPFREPCACSRRAA